MSSDVLSQPRQKNRMGTALFANVVTEQTPPSVRARPMSTTLVASQSWGFLATTESPSEVAVYGERFSISEDAGCIILTHPKWSLLGSGRTQTEAYADLIAEARDLAAELRDDDVSSLSPQAQRLREFVLRIS